MFIALQVNNQVLYTCELYKVKRSFTCTGEPKVLLVCKQVKIISRIFTCLTIRALRMTMSLTSNKFSFQLRALRMTMSLTSNKFSFQLRALRMTMSLNSNKFSFQLRALRMTMSLTSNKFSFQLRAFFFEKKGVNRLSPKLDFL